MSTKTNILGLSEFFKTVKNHEVSILLTQGVHRHISVRRSDTRNMSFQITTWPYYLCVSGDMGTYTFSHMYDMFDFFRCAELEGPLYINPDYWAEKCVAECPHSPIKSYSPNAFEAYVKDYLSSYHSHDGNILDPLKEEVDDLISYHKDDEFEAVIAIRNASLTNDGIPIDWSDFNMDRCKEFSYRYLWCLYAIVWTITKLETSLEK